VLDALQSLEVDGTFELVEGTDDRPATSILGDNEGNQRPLDYLDLAVALSRNSLEMQQAAEVCKSCGSGSLLTP
jgi:hypothetical protein